MNRRGAALLLVLWLVVAMAGIAAATLRELRVDTQAARNRVALTRAAWAREGCVAILLARFDSAVPLRGVDSTDLGHGSWCRAEVYDPAERLNLNLATEAQLATVIANDTVAAAIMDWRDADSIARPLGAEEAYYAMRAEHAPRNGPFAAIDELRLVRGIDGPGLSALERLLTVHGSGRINAARAPAQVVAALPGFSDADARAVLLARAGTGAPRTLGELLDRLPVERAKQLYGWGPELQAAVTFSVEELVVEVTGAAGASGLRARSELVAVPTPTRLAVVRRVIW